jgi:hypothetical protein
MVQKFRNTSLSCRGLALVLLLVVCTVPISSAGSPPGDEWFRIFDSSEIVLYSVQAPPGGGYVAGGEAALGAAVAFLNETGYPDRIVYAQGELVSSAYIYVREMPEDGLLLVTERQEIVATSSAGKPRWTYVPGENRTIRAIDTAGGGAVLVADADRSVLIHLSGEGDEEWIRPLCSGNGEGRYHARSVRSLPGGGAVVGGSVATQEGTSAFLLVFGENGAIVRELLYPQYDEITTIQPVSGGGYMAAATGADSGTSPTAHDAVSLLGIASDGTIRMERPVTVFFSSVVILTPLSDGGYLIAGPAPESFGGAGGFMIVRTAENGETAWTRTIPDAIVTSVQQTPDGGYMIGGLRKSVSEDVGASFLIKMGPEKVSVPAPSGGSGLVAGVALAVLAAGYARKLRP